MFLVAKGKQNCAAGRVSFSHFSEMLNLSRKGSLQPFLGGVGRCLMLGSDPHCVLTLT